MPRTKSGYFYVKTSLAVSRLLLCVRIFGVTCREPAARCRVRAWWASPCLKTEFTGILFPLGMTGGFGSFAVLGGGRAVLHLWAQPGVQQEPAGLCEVGKAEVAQIQL